jgi:hypothetical protein
MQLVVTSFPQLCWNGVTKILGEVRRDRLLIHPLVDASFLMQQRNPNTLADILMMLVKIYKGMSIS